MAHAMRSVVCWNQGKARAALVDCSACGGAVSVGRGKLALPFLGGQRKLAGLLVAAEVSGARCLSSAAAGVEEERAAGTRLRVTKPALVRSKKRNVVVNAAAGEGANSEAVAEPSGAASGESSGNPIAALKLQSDLLERKAKKLELRRKRLVRKRHLRKKGRWPPSKMKKNENV